MIAMPAAMSMAVSESVEAHVFEIEGLVVDAACRRRNPVGKLARLGDTSHERCHEGAIGCARQPAVDVRVPLFRADHVALGIDVRRCKRPDLAMECLVRHLEPGPERKDRPLLP